jgi:hypothetical protein
MAQGYSSTHAFTQAKADAVIAITFYRMRRAYRKG